MLNEPSKSGRGGGIGVLHKKNLTFKPKKTTEYVSFEHMELLLIAECHRI